MKVHLLTCSLLAGICCLAQRGLPADETVTVTHTTEYAQHVDFLPEMVKKLKAPKDWEVGIAASGLGKPRMMFLGDKGQLYITRRDGGDVLMLTDANKDNVFDDLKTVVADFKGVHGITIKDQFLYLCNNNELRRYKLLADGSVDPESKDMLFKDMPSAGQHPNRTMDFGPDGKLYISIGSLCNDCKEGDREAATIVQVDPATWKRTIFASGLRNTIGFGWHPKTAELWGMDNGGDAKGDDWPPEELNLIQMGGAYGYPLAYGKREVDKSREDPAGDSKEQVAKQSVPSVMEFQAHMAPIDFRFFKSGANSGDALVCWHGSWNRSEPVGFKVQRISFENGSPKEATDFLSGFLIGKDARFGRPAGLAIAADNTVYISDDANGVIYFVKPKK